MYARQYSDQSKETGQASVVYQSVPSEQSMIAKSSK